MKLRRLLSIVLVSALASACSGSPASPPIPRGELPLSAPAPKKVQHVVVIVQENRSFDNFFATYPGADGATSGLCTMRGTTRSIPLQKVGLISPKEPPYAWSSFQIEYGGGNMDGFCRNTQGGTLPHDLPYEYVDPALLTPLWTIAQQYVLADHMFQTQQSGSFTAHQDLIRGDTALNSTQSVIDNPVTPYGKTYWGCGAPAGTTTHLLSDTHQYTAGPFPCFTWTTLRDLLDAKGVSWKYYTAATLVKPAGGNIWNAFFAISDVYNGPEWQTNVTNKYPYEKTIFRDIENGNLPAVSWVIPDYQNSDHSGEAKDTGPSWVASVVNAVGESPYWDTTAIVVLWDDWGGWYDNVKPPQLYYDGLSFRVPCLIVGAYAKKGYVSHTQYEYASILRFIEDNWGLGQLGPHDTNAHSIVDAFDFAGPPRPFQHVNAKYSQAFFERQAPSYRAVDDR